MLQNGIQKHAAYREILRSQVCLKSCPSLELSHLIQGCKEAPLSIHKPKPGTLLLESEIYTLSKTEWQFCSFTAQPEEVPPLTSLDGTVQ